GGAVDIVTARAVAPLKSLLGRCFPLLGKSGAMGLFPKGQNAELELRQARESRTGKAWTMNATLAPSRTDPAGRIIVIRDVERSSKTPKDPNRSQPIRRPPRPSMLDAMP